MKKSFLIVAGMLVLVNPLLAKAETTPLYDFETHCDEVIKLEKTIKMNAPKVEIKMEGVEYEEVPTIVESNEETTEKVTEKVVEETVVTEVITEEEIVVPSEEIVIEEEVIVEEVVEEEYYHNHETDATCYKCDLPLIHCGCELPNPTIETCEECGLDELHCVCEVTEFPTCDLCGNEFVNCHCEF